jgi:hypothetical protein
MNRTRFNEEVGRVARDEDGDTEGKMVTFNERCESQSTGVVDDVCVTGSYEVGAEVAWKMRVRSGRGCVIFWGSNQGGGKPKLRFWGGL